jgi:hypothetical protein
MLPKATNVWRAILIAGLVAWFVPWSLAKLLSLGGSPEETGTKVRYRLRPGMRFILLVVAGTGLASLCYGIQDIRRGIVASGVIMTVIGLTAIALPSMAARSELTLDEDGLHSRSAICSEQAILWNDLSHVEKLYNYRMGTNRYYIRSSQGTTIVVGDSSFDTSDLLQRIRHRRSLPERAYKRKAWYE